jgi:hypothetical protein
LTLAIIRYYYYPKLENFGSIIRCRLSDLVEQTMYLLSKGFLNLVLPDLFLCSEEVILSEIPGRPTLTTFIGAWKRQCLEGGATMNCMTWVRGGLWQQLKQ